MFKIIGTRCSGKTTKLLEKANNNPNYVIVEPTKRMAKHVEIMAKDKGYNVRVITANECLFHNKRTPDDVYLIDEVEMFLRILNVEGYTMSF